MKRLDLRTKNRIKELILKGSSLNKISSKTSIGKTTIYYYRRKIVGRKIDKISINLKNKERIGEIIGFFAGDGSFYYDTKTFSRRVRFYFNKDELQLINYYKNSLQNLLNKKPQVYNPPSAQSVIILEINSKEFIKFIINYLKWDNKKTKTIGLKSKLLINDKEFLVGFLRGLIDSDGYVRKGRNEIYFGSISINLIRNFEHCLNKLDITHKRYTQKREGRQDFFKVRLTGIDVDRFINLVRPLKSLK